MSGETIGSYRLGECIGRGGFGAVYKCVHVENGTFAAVKQIQLAKIPKDQLKSIMMEIDLLKSLKHENIVEYIGYTKTKDHLFILLEFVDSGSLRSVVQKFGKFSETLVRVYIAQVLQGLFYLHQQGVIHRDIKGANILTTRDGRVKLADFGVATPSDSSESASVVGTPYWMAPEIIQLNGASTKSDIWSVGCTIIELINGNPPYYDLQPMPALFRIVQDDHPPLPDSISPALKDFLLACFQKEPHLRVNAKKLLKHPWLQKKTEPAPEKEKITPTTTTSPSNSAILNDSSSSFAALLKNSEDSVKSEQEDEDEDFDSAFNFLDDDKSFSSFLSPEDVKHISENTTNATSNTPKRKAKVDKSERKEKKKKKPKKSKKDKTKKKTRKKRKTKPVNDILSKFTEEAGDDDDFFNNLDIDADFISGGNQRFIHPDEKIDASPAMLAGSHKATIKKFVETEDDNWDFDEFDLGASMSDSSDFASKLVTKLNEVDEAPTELNFDSDDDPFADVFEEDDDDFSFASTAPKDNYVKMSAEILTLIGKLQPDGHSTEEIEESCTLLKSIFKENPENKSALIRHHGVIPIIEVLEVTKHSMLVNILQLVNQLIEPINNNTDREIQENLCRVGGIPIILRYASKEYSKEVRIEVARFIKLLCNPHSLSLQMFIACRGLPVLVNFLDTASYTTDKDLILLAIQCIEAVFKLNSPTPKNDFCRLFVKAGVLIQLGSVLIKVIKDSTVSPSYIEQVTDLFLLFSHGDNVVKSYMSESEVIDLIFRSITLLQFQSPELLVPLLKCIKQLSSDTKTLSLLQTANCIPKLIDLLFKVKSPEKVGTDVNNQILSALFNLTRIDPVRQEQAANAGIIPHLKTFIATSSPLKQFALSIIIELGHVSKVRHILWKNNIAEYYMQLLSSEKIWRVNIIDAIDVWLSDSNESAKVEKILLSNFNVFVDVLKTTDQTLEKILASFLNIITRDNNSIIKALPSQPEFIPNIIARLIQKKQSTRCVVTLLKILVVVLKSHGNPKLLWNKFDLQPVITSLPTKFPESVLIDKLEKQIVEICNK